MISRASNPLIHFENNKGEPLAGGFLFTFVAGTNIPVKTYNSNGTENPVCIVLDSMGNADVFLDTSTRYKFKVCDKNGNEVIPPIDNVTANTNTFVAQGSGTIDATTTTVDGKTIVTFKVKDGSIGIPQFKDPLPLIAGNGIKLTEKLSVDTIPCVVVSLSDDVIAKLESLDG